MGVASLYKSMGATSLHKSMGAASLHKSMGAAPLCKSMGTESLHKSIGAVSLYKSMGAASLHQSTGAAFQHKSMRPALLLGGAARKNATPMNWCRDATRTRCDTRLNDRHVAVTSHVTIIHTCVGTHVAVGEDADDLGPDEPWDGRGCVRQTQHRPCSAQRHHTTLSSAQGVTCSEQTAARNNPPTHPSLTHSFSRSLIHTHTHIHTTLLSEHTPSHTHTHTRPPPPKVDTHTRTHTTTTVKQPQHTQPPNTHTPLPPPPQ